MTRDEIKKSGKRIIKGIRYSEKYGSHPGNIWIIVLIVMGFIAGYGVGLTEAIIGAAAMLAIFGPIYLFGAYERGK